MGRGVPFRLELTKKDRQHIEELLGSSMQSVRTVMRALVLRQLDQGRSTTAIGAGVSLSAKTVWLTGRRYQEGGLERALFDAPRPGKTPALDQAQRQQVVALVCSPPPTGRARWTVRLLAEESVRRNIVPAIGREAIRVLLESHDLKPWREKNVVCRQAR